MFRPNVKSVSSQPRPSEHHGCRKFPVTRHYPMEEPRRPQTRQGEEELSGFELIVGIDFTKSNTWKGENSFGERCLHDIDGPANPYMVALSVIARTLGIYDNDNRIPCYGFGDATTEGDRVFSFYPGNQPARGLDPLLERYKQIVPTVDMAGPTSFAPLIRQAMREVYNSGMQFHVLLILADGQISEDCLEDTKKAIVEACSFPLSIVMIGVGDGPWDDMTKFDSDLPGRSWDNFHLFDFERTFNWSPFNYGLTREGDFRMQALAELPEQYSKACELMGEDKKTRVADLVNGFSPSLVIDPPVWHC